MRPVGGGCGHDAHTCRQFGFQLGSVEWIEFAGQEAHRVSRHPPVSQILVPCPDPNWPITPGQHSPHPSPKQLRITYPLYMGYSCKPGQLRPAWIVSVARRNLKANRGFSGQLSPFCEQLFLILVQTEICPAAAQPFLHSQPRRYFFAYSLYHQQACCPLPSHSIASVAPTDPRLFSVSSHRSTVYPPWASSRMKSRAFTPSSRGSSRA